MEILNAIAKVRFASARPQRVRLAKGGPYAVEMVCMEAGQQAKVTTGPWTYYVVTGTARLTARGWTGELSSGQMATTESDEAHALANAGQGRLVCLAIGPPS